MKKLTLILFAALLFTGNVKAQEKPAKGSFGTEVQFNPFDQNGNTFKLDGLKLRYFLTDKDAIRLKVGFNLNHSNLTDEVTNEDENYNSFVYKYSTGDFRIDLGYERHFDISKRVNIYVGGSLGFTKHFASTNIEMSSNGISSDYKGEIKNGAITSVPEDDELDSENLLPNVNDRAYYGFNVAAFTGLDFYVYKGLYIGTELGLKLGTQKTNKMTYTAIISRQKYSEESTNKSTTLEMKTYIEPVLRLGWTF